MLEPINVYESLESGTRIENEKFIEKEHKIKQIEKRIKYKLMGLASIMITIIFTFIIFTCIYKKMDSMVKKENIFTKLQKISTNETNLLYYDDMDDTLKLNNRMNNLMYEVEFQNYDGVYGVSTILYNQDNIVDTHDKKSKPYDFIDYSIIPKRPTIKPTYIKNQKIKFRNLIR
jgi:hypothetical protein